MHIYIKRWDIFKGLVQAFKNLYLVWKIEIMNNIRIEKINQNYLVSRNN